MNIYQNALVDVLRVGGILALVIATILGFLRDQAKLWSETFREERNNRKKDKEQLIRDARFLISNYRKSNPIYHTIDFTDEQAYMAISSHLDAKIREYVQDENPDHYRERLKRLNDEVSKLAKEWKIFV